jgi:microcystin-dependent protein
MIYIIKDIILFILVITIIYLIYKTTFGINDEKFTSPDDAIYQAVNEQYIKDINTMIYLERIANTLTNNDTLTLSANKVIINGNLKVSGNVIIKKDTHMALELFPKYTVIAWGSVEQLKGWADCNGAKWKLDKDGDAYNTDDLDGIQTPDLNSRFILGKGSSNNGGYIRLGQYNTGGAPTQTLSIENMPAHSHLLSSYTAQTTDLDNNVLGNNNSACNYSEINSSKNFKKYFSYDLKGALIEPTVGKTSTVGQSTTFNIMPPYYVLYYKMKLY